VLFDEKTGEGIADFDVPDVAKGRVEFRAEKKEGRWAVVEFRLPKSGIKTAWTGAAWKSETPPKTDYWALATLLKDDLPTGWAVVKSEEDDSRQGVQTAARWYGLPEESLRRYRYLEVKGPGEQKLDLVAYQGVDAKGLDAVVKVFRERHLPAWNSALIDKEDVALWLDGDQSGRTAPVVEGVEDRLRAKMGLAPVKREDPTAIRPEDLPPKWGVTQPAAPADLAVELKGLPQPQAGDVRGAWAASVGEGATVARVVSARFYESDPAKAFLKAMRTVDPPAGTEMRVLNGGTRIVAASYPESAPQEPFRALVAAMAKRIGYSSDDWQIEDKVLGTALDEKALTVSFEIAGIPRKELCRGGRWEIKVWCGNRREIVAQRPVPEAWSMEEHRLRTSISLPVEGNFRRFLETRPRWLTVRIRWGGEKDPQIDLSNIALDGRWPPSLKQAFGRLALTEKDMPLGWYVGTRWRNLGVPQYAYLPEDAVPIAALVEDAVRVDPAKLEMGYLAAVGTDLKLEKFQVILVILLRMPDADARREVVEKLKGSKNPGKSDRHEVWETGDAVGIGLIFGVNDDAGRAFDKIVAAMKAKE
jgi:hypothetical protein